LCQQRIMNVFRLVVFYINTVCTVIFLLTTVLGRIILSTHLHRGLFSSNVTLEHRVFTEAHHRISKLFPKRTTIPRRTACIVNRSPPFRRYIRIRSWAIQGYKKLSYKKRTQTRVVRFPFLRHVTIATYSLSF